MLDLISNHLSHNERKQARSFICFTQSKFSTNREIKFLIKSSSSTHHLTIRAQHNKIGWNQSKTPSCINLDNDFESDKKWTMMNFPTPVSLRVAEVGGVVRIREYFNSCWELNKFREKRLAHLASPAKRSYCCIGSSGIRGDIISLSLFWEKIRWVVFLQ